MADIFISYSQKDRSVAEGLAHFLVESGYHVWWDYELVGGVKFRSKIKAELDAAKAAIVIWTPNSVESEWVIEEADDAKSSKKLLPVRVPELDYKSIPLGFRQFQTDPVNKPELILRALDDRKILPSNKPVERKQESLQTPGGIIDATSVAASDEIAQWAYIKQSGQPKDFYDYLAKYPHSDFAELARSRIAALEDRAWTAIAGTNDHTRVVDFIKQFPGGKYSRDAQRILYSLEDTAWSNVDKNDPTALLAHKAKFPGSFSRAWIDTRLDELEKEKQEAAAWEQLTLAPTKEGIENYIRRFPLGAHVDAAREMLAPLDLNKRRANRWGEIKEQGFSDQFKLFIDEFKTGSEVDEARTILTDRQRRKEEAAWERVRNTRHPAEMLAFLRDFPDGAHTKSALGAIQAIPNFVDDEAWAMVVNTDNKVLYEGYLLTLPNGMHASKARAKLGIPTPPKPSPATAGFIPQTKTGSTLPPASAAAAVTGPTASQPANKPRPLWRKALRFIVGLATLGAAAASISWLLRYLDYSSSYYSQMSAMWGMGAFVGFVMFLMLK